MEMATISQAKNIAAGFNATASGSGAKALGRDDFLKLLLAQLQHQDPMSAMKDEQFIAQLAQFSSLEETQTMRKSLSTLLNVSQLSQSTGLIGRTVQVKEAKEGAPLVTGTVSSVKMENGTPKLVINGQLFQLDAVQNVQ